MVVVGLGIGDVEGVGLRDLETGDFVGVERG